MPLNLDAIGTVGDPVERSWHARDALLYAVAVGAGAVDPTDELAFTTENSRDVRQKVLPTFAVVVGMGAGGALRNIGTFNPAMLVHAEQSFELHRPLAPEGTVRITSRLVDILDKGKGALVVTESQAVDPASGDPVFTTRSGAFIRGEGGFAPEADRAGGGAPDGSGRTGPSGSRSGSASGSASGSGSGSAPERAADHVVSYPTLPHQALIYRLCGDRNPLHSDPSFAALAGFDRPILHGLCTYGFTGRALLHTLCGSDPARLRAMYGRFSRPVLPGDTLTISIWVDSTPGGASFQTTTGDGTVVIDRGRCTFA
jgi:acyl dehydratase